MIRTKSCIHYFICLAYDYRIRLIPGMHLQEQHTKGHLGQFLLTLHNTCDHLSFLMPSSCSVLIIPWWVRILFLCDLVLFAPCHVVVRLFSNNEVWIYILNLSLVSCNSQNITLIHKDRLDIFTKRHLETHISNSKCCFPYNVFGIYIQIPYSVLSLYQLLS